MNGVCAEQNKKAGWTCRQSGAIDPLRNESTATCAYQSDVQGIFEQPTTRTLRNDQDIQNTILRAPGMQPMNSFYDQLTSRAPLALCEKYSHKPNQRFTCKDQQSKQCVPDSQGQFPSYFTCMVGCGDQTHIPFHAHGVDRSVHGTYCKTQAETIQKLTSGNDLLQTIQPLLCSGMSQGVRTAVPRNATKSGISTSIGRVFLGNPNKSEPFNPKRGGSAALLPNKYVDQRVAQTVHQHAPHVMLQQQ